jgi:processive 1,2-diacylglycerol beta-glucosyltransferase
MVLSAAAGAGHVRAAEALVSAFGLRGVHATHVEALKHTNPLFRRAYSDLYVQLVNRQPQLLGYLYHALDRPWQLEKRRLALDRLNTGALIRLLRRERPTLALCTHFLPAEILVYLRKKRLLDVPIGVVVTDFDAHALCLYRGIDWYFVACEETREHLAALGIPRDTIHVTGIPIDPAFAVPLSKTEVRRERGLEADRTTILVSAGGFGVGSIEPLVRTLHEIRHSVQFVVVCGKNAALERRLTGFPEARHRMKVIGYTTEMDRWMAAADFLVGKAGGLTSSEALARGLLLIIVNPIPGQEERNSDHFLEEGAAIRSNNLPALAFKVDALLDDPDRIARMREAVQRLAKPTAAAAVVSVVTRAGPGSGEEGIG